MAAAAPTVFWRVTLPLAVPGLVITALFSFMTAWSEYIVAAQVMQDEAMFTLPLGIKSFQASMSTQWGLYAAAVDPREHPGRRGIPRAQQVSRLRPHARIGEGVTRLLPESDANWPPFLSLAAITRTLLAHLAWRVVIGLFPECLTLFGVLKQPRSLQTTRLPPGALPAGMATAPPSRICEMPVAAGGVVPTASGY